MRNLKYLMFAAVVASCATAPLAHAAPVCKNIERVVITSDQEETPSNDFGYEDNGFAYVEWNQMNTLPAFKVDCYTKKDDTTPAATKQFKGAVPASCVQRNGELNCQ